MSRASSNISKSHVCAAAAAMLTSACAPTVGVVSQSDSAEGYRKTVVVEAKPNGTILRREQIALKINGATRFVDRRVPGEGQDIQVRSITFPGSELIRRTDKALVEYDVSYSIWPFQKQHDAIATSAIGGAPPATYRLQVAKSCFEVGEPIKLSAIATPAPVTDVVKFALKTNGSATSCTPVAPDAISSRRPATTTRASCTGDITFELAAMDRPLLRPKSNVVSIKIQNAVVPPQLTSQKKGNIVEQPTEDEGPIRVQEVTLIWSHVAGAQKYGVRIVRARDNALMEQALLNAGVGAYVASLSPGEIYSWTVRAQVDGCAGATWSKHSPANSLDLR